MCVELELNVWEFCVMFSVTSISHAPYNLSVQKIAKMIKLVGDIVLATVNYLLSHSNSAFEFPRDGFRGKYPPVVE